MNTFVRQNLFWLADKAFALHTVATFAALVWIAAQGLPAVTGMMLSLWILTLVIWSEWRNVA